MFLTDDNSFFVTEMLKPRLGVRYFKSKKKDEKSKHKKSLVQIGVHVLTIHECEFRKTKTQGDMLFVSLIKKKDVYFDDGEPVSYLPIDCYHVASRSGDVITRWFDRFTSDMRMDVLEMLHGKLIKKPKFKAVIGLRQREKMFDGQPMLDGWGRKTYTWENFIESVHRIDDDIELVNEDYLRLFQYKELKTEIVKPKEIPF